jgi:hypothetical protein
MVAAPRAPLLRVVAKAPFPISSPVTVRPLKVDGKLTTALSEKSTCGHSLMTMLLNNFLAVAVCD